MAHNNRQMRSGMPAAYTYPAVAAFETWMEMNRPVISAMADINGQLFQQFSRANSEWVGLVGRVVEEDLAASKKLMACRTMQDVAQAYRECLQRAQQQCQTEIQHFSRLNQSLTSETISAMRSRLEEAADEIRH